MDVNNSEYINYLYEYLPVLLFALVALGITSVALITSYLIVPQKPDKNKLSPYECGMVSFSDARKTFDIRFYLVAILFVIFDVEVAFLMPWAVVLGSVGMFGYLVMMLFLSIVIIGFMYEWKKGVLEWD